jgi:hypothetical protein
MGCRPNGRRAAPKERAIRRDHGARSICASADRGEIARNSGSIGGARLLTLQCRPARQGCRWANLHRKLHRAKCRRETNLLRRAMRFGTSIALAIAALVGACASNPDFIDPIYVSPSTFEHLTCRQIGEEQKRITREEAANMQDGKPTDAEQVGLLKGAMEALEQVSIEKGCNIEFQHG